MADTTFKEDLKNNKGGTVRYIKDCFKTLFEDEGFLKWWASSNFLYFLKKTCVTENRKQNAIKIFMIFGYKILSPLTIQEIGEKEQAKCYF